MLDKIPLVTACVAVVLGVGLSTRVAVAAEKPWLDNDIIKTAEPAEHNGMLNEIELKELIRKGSTLFSGKFTRGDGIGRPMATQAIIPTKRKRPAKQLFDRVSGPEANSCASCHNEPVAGGAGNFATNVFASGGFTSQGAQSTDPQFSNERNTNHLMGAGLVELLAREMTAELQAIRVETVQKARDSRKQQMVKLNTKGVEFGEITAFPDGIVELSAIEGIDADLVVRPFSQKGVMTSLRQFTINALNHHHGIQASERFGLRWTGENDFDGDGVADEIETGNISALVAWQATLPPPVRKKLDNKKWLQAAGAGEKLFGEIGCGSCHRKFLPLKNLMFKDPGPVDAAGTLRRGESNTGKVYNLALLDWAKSLQQDDHGNVLVPLFGDLKRHNMVDSDVAALGNELLSQRFVERGEFMTSELWGIASTAPYGHRGDLTSLGEIIEAHGGEGRQSRDAWLALRQQQRDNIIAFLKTLVIEQ